MAAVQKKQAETAQELDAMLNSHRAWVYRVNKILICGMLPTEETVAEDAHLHCTLGDWLENRARQLDLDEGIYADLVTRHKQVHDLAREMVLTAQAGHRIRGEIYDGFLEASEGFAGLIEVTYDGIIASITATDPLTGAENRTSMASRLEERVTRAKATGGQIWIVMIDLDHFKSINDLHGHELGDTVLKEFAAVVMNHIRADDLFFRYGGEEFLLCIGDVDAATVSGVAERLRSEIAQREFSTPKGTLFSVTASFGVAALSPETEINKAINAADAAMYAAKHAGRNRVKFAPGTLQPA